MDPSERYNVFMRCSLLDDINNENYKTMSYLKVMQHDLVKLKETRAAKKAERDQMH